MAALTRQMLAGGYTTAAAPERPGASQERPGSVPGAPRSVPGASRERPRAFRERPGASREGSWAPPRSYLTNTESTKHKKHYVFENVFRTLKNCEICDILRTEHVLRRNERARRAESAAGRGLEGHTNLVVLIMILQDNKKQKTTKKN